MHSGLTFGSIAALFGSMVVLACVPSVSVLLVSTRSAAYGFLHGVFTTIGIAVGDIVYILLAIYGLSFVADLLDSHFVLIKYLAGAYLVWLGIVLLTSKPEVRKVERGLNSSLCSSFLTGLFVTLGDQKAVLFYLGFLPAFIDLSVVTIVDTGIIIATATVALAGAKLGYAFFADSAMRVLKNTKILKGINITAGFIMIFVGVFLLLSAR